MRAFRTVDVFTDRRFGGNPLAVVLDGRGLSAAAMQAIAREFNLSETTFVLPPRDPRNTAQVRIFTPGGELPFAGHPNVGTGYVLAREGNALGRGVADRMVFEEGAGDVVIEVCRDAAGRVSGARIRAPRPLTLSPAPDAALLAPAVGLTVADTVGVPVIGSVGTPFCLLEVADVGALGRARPNPAAFAAAQAAHVGEVRLRALYLYAVAAERVRARMFGFGLGVPEDPATGSAAAALAGALAQRVGRVEWSIAQGIEMGRPSRIDASVTLRDGRAAEVRIAGSCVPVMEGRLAV